MLNTRQMTVEEFSVFAQRPENGDRMWEHERTFLEYNQKAGF